MPESATKIEKVTDEKKPVLGTWPYFAEDESQAAIRVLSSGKVNYWTGQECREFEKEYAAKIGVRHAVALANGTVALELALIALNVGAGDEVIVTPRSFIASASCAVVRGCVPVFADVNRDSQNISPETIEPKITKNTKAIVVVHLAGWPCEMDGILDLAAHHNIAVVEDCAQAHGALYRGRHVGTMGDVNAFSFCQDKIITTAGEGGLLTTNQKSLWEKAWSYKDHGKSWDAVYNRSYPVGYRFLHEDFGTNWRMLEVQGAIGRVCLKKLDSWVDTRRRNAAILADAFGRLSALRLTTPPDYIRHSYYKYYAFLRPEALKAGWSKQRILSEINEAGVPALSLYGEMYLEKAFEKRGFRPEAPLPVTQELAETALVLLVHPTLTTDAMHYTAGVVSTVIKSATK